MYYKELAHVIMEAGKSKSAVWAGGLETPVQNWAACGPLLGAAFSKSSLLYLLPQFLR